jgi:hypothetical protein
MPLVLMQRAWRDDPKYLDTEFVVYHYPQQYFDRIHGGERFVYYRPARGAPPEEASSYFGCGELGDVWDDVNNPGHRFVGIEKPIKFTAPVSFQDATGQLYESRFANRNAFQGQSVRYVDDLDFHRILDAAGLTGALFASAPTVSDVIRGRASPLLAPPRDRLRPLNVVPEGTGYRPAATGPDVHEAAALQERARADHQDTLRMLKRMVEDIGGSCSFSNNVDLLADIRERKLLVEVKSLVTPSATVDRMRYGMGQLFDYSVRYRDEIGAAAPVLAFGTAPGHDTAWIAEILEGNGVAFVARDSEGISPFNELARGLPFFR